MGSLRLAAACGLVTLAGCLSVAGIDGFHADPCFDGCDGGPSGDDGGLPSGDGAADGAPLPEAGPPSAGQSTVTLSGTGVAVGAVAIATLTTKDEAGTRVRQGGSAVTFVASGGTSVVQIGATTDVGDGTYRATLTGVTEGTKVSIGATLDGAPITTPPPSIRVVGPVVAGLTLSLDAADADAAKNFGGKGCGAAGLTKWSDLSTSHFDGTLAGFPAPPCTTVSGWNGDGTPENPYRLTFDGIDDEVAFGAVNSIQKQTVIVFARKTGQGTAGNTGNGGLSAVFPIVTKGTAEAENDAVDENYYLGVTPGGRLGIDFEQSNPPASANNPITGNTNLVDDDWYMLAFTLDSAASSRVLYVNGVPDGTSATSNVPSTGSSSRLVVGGSDTSTGTANGRFKGDVAVVLTYDRALGAAEIAQDCDSYSSRFGITGCPP